MRGIGYTLINLINNINDADRKKHHFVFYAYPFNENDSPLDILNLKGLKYEIRELRKRQRIHKKWPGRLNLLASTLNQLIDIRDLHFGDSRIADLKGVDFFLQTDQSQCLPRKAKLRNGLIIYDIIPYVLEWEYMWSYKTARRHGFSRKAALRVHVRRLLYAYKIRINSARADTLFSISESTKQDFVEYLGVRENKINVVLLGTNPPPVAINKTPVLKHYVKTSWGYMQRDLKRFDQKTPFLLYVGGADRRRKLEDLVSAFNMLRAQDINIRLVLAGDSMQGPENIATEQIQHALKSSSYKEDIIFVGFVDDDTRDWLYRRALAFVFPSRYEGFGLPVLEAMSYGTPVISYDNEATKEVALNEPMYVHDADGIYVAVTQLLGCSKKELQSISNRNKEHVKNCTWEKTSQQVLSIIEAYK